MLAGFSAIKREEICDLKQTAFLWNSVEKRNRLDRPKRKNNVLYSKNESFPGRSTLPQPPTLAFTWSYN
jgi:hypothetical protein